MKKTTAPATHYNYIREYVYDVQLLHPGTDSHDTRPGYCGAEPRRLRAGAVIGQIVGVRTAAEKEAGQAPAEWCLIRHGAPGRGTHYGNHSTLEAAKAAANKWAAARFPRIISAALTPEEWAAADAATLAQVAAHRAELLPAGHVLQLVPQAQEPEAAPAEVPQLVPTGRPDVLQLVAPPEVGDVIEYHVPGRELANGWKIPTIQIALDVSEAGDVLTEKDGWVPAGTYSSRKKLTTADRTPTLKDWYLFAGGRSWLMVGKAPVKPGRRTITERQATSSARRRVTLERQRVERNHAAQLEQYHAAGPLVALMYQAPAAEPPRFTTQEAAATDTQRRQDSTSEMLRGMAARFSRRARLLVAGLDQYTVAAYAHAWSRQGGGFDPASLCDFITAPGAEKRRQEALRAFENTAEGKALRRYAIAA